jgi:hypothetical protein
MVTIKIKNNIIHIIFDIIIYIIFDIPFILKLKTNLLSIG